MKVREWCTSATSSSVVGRSELLRVVFTPKDFCQETRPLTPPSPTPDINWHHATPPAGRVAPDDCGLGLAGRGF